MSEPATVICTFRVKSGCEEEFTRLLERHWPTLRDLGLATDDPPQHFRGGEQRSGEPIFFHIFDWASEESAGIAHEHPEVMAIWEPMDGLCEDRGGKPGMDFPHVRRLRLRGET